MEGLEIAAEEFKKNKENGNREAEGYEKRKVFH